MFLDGILVTATEDGANLKRLHDVLPCIEDYGLRLENKKCLFMQYQVNYLGHTVSDSSIITMSTKVQAIENAPVPENVSELRSFLGLVNCYGNFVPKLSTVLRPLRLLLFDDMP